MLRSRLINVTLTVCIQYVGCMYICMCIYYAHTYVYLWKYEYGFACLIRSCLYQICVDLYLCISKNAHVYPYIYAFCILYDYVQHRENTVGVA